MSQGFAALMEPFLDTIIICLLTALVIVVSGVNHRARTWASRSLGCVRDRGAVVPAVLASSRCCSPIYRVGLGYYGEQAWTWLFSESKRSRVAFRLFLCGMLSIAATFPLDQVVNIVDSCSFCMAIPN